MAGGGRGNRGNRNQNGQGGIPEDPAVVEQRNQQRQMVCEAMDELRQGSESSLAKILDKGQVARLKQIQLQLEGTRAVLREDMVDKLQIDEAQYAMIQEAMSRESHRAASDTTVSGRDDEKCLRQNEPNGANGGQNNAGNGDNGGGACNGNNGNGNGGDNGGGRGGRGNFDPEAMRKVMESPEMKAQMEEIQTRKRS